MDSRTFLRLSDELNQLSDRVKKLEVFLTTDKAHSLPLEHRKLLELQLPHMKAYLNILDIRYLMVCKEISNGKVD